MQQRARVGVDALLRDLAQAGAGATAGAEAGPLYRQLPPVVPRRLGLTACRSCDGRTAGCHHRRVRARPRSAIDARHGAACRLADSRCRSVAELSHRPRPLRPASWRHGPRVRWRRRLRLLQADRRARSSRGSAPSGFAGGSCATRLTPRSSRPSSTRTTSTRRCGSCVTTMATAPTCRWSTTWSVSSSSISASRHPPRHRSLRLVSPTASTTPPGHRSRVWPGCRRPAHRWHLFH